MVKWEYYDKFEQINARFLPLLGEGETIATQIVAAVNKLVYKYYNDGDVYDNTECLSGGWLNDLSSYANWLHKHTDARSILEGIWDCRNDSDYEDLLKELADRLLDAEDLEAKAKEPKKDSIYTADGPFEFRCIDEDDDDYDEEEDEW